MRRISYLEVTKRIIKSQVLNLEGVVDHIQLDGTGLDEACNIHPVGYRIFKDIP